MEKHFVSHRPPSYVEWWYFHFTASNGSAINLVLHETDIFGLHDRPYLSLSILLPGRPARYFRSELENIMEPGGRIFLDRELGLIADEDDRIVFDVRPANDCHFSAEMIKLAGPIEIENGYIYRNATGQASHWVIRVPHAVFTATLRLDDELIKLEGTAYHDHQWGNVFIQDYVSDWVWGHFSNEQIAFTFFQILAQNGKFISRLALISEEGRFTGTVLSTNYLDALINNQSPDSFSDSTAVGFLFDLADVRFEIHPSLLMRSRLHEQHGRVKASYLRWATRATLDGACGPHRLYGISEYIRIRPTTYGSHYQSKHHQHHFRHSDSNHLAHRSTL